ncbi:sperm-associated antigen 1 [Sabethes cyaneus]|uniref:sperm-associated antigen 1 n=1 Tax=Sabethes cyaneus TaxID=53552 RepID=UPI00237DECB0|nr:sperm-associated antigen 1 [Sabethes cyaneus]
MANKPRRLLEKYEILLEHLDFEYIERCTDERELEKIVKILRSGEEGYFPQLTSFAEQCLQALNPSSKIFRKETPLGTKDSVPSESWNQIQSELEQWKTEITTVHERILNLKDEPVTSNVPIRNSGVNTVNYLESQNVVPSNVPRLRSCDYQGWDQYDAETEMLKMDLHEERCKESVGKQNKANDNGDGDYCTTEHSTLGELSEPERKTLASSAREKGNDYFRCKEFDSALREYTFSLKIFPTAACFNNRAMTYLKQQRYSEAILDCDSCLKLEPNNSKAFLRKAEALLNNNRPREAYKMYCNVLSYDANNTVALKRADDLRKQFSDLPPPNAWQITIEDVRNEPEEDDYVALIKPKRITKDKLPNAIKLLEKETAKIVQNYSVENQQNTVKIGTTLFQPDPGVKKNLIEEL